MDFDGMNYFAVWSPVKAPVLYLRTLDGHRDLESEDDVLKQTGMRLLKPGEEDAVSFTVRFSGGFKVGSGCIRP